ncbi:MAG TPA: hypothetical protein DDZ81_01240 [Acetobacteraceae bacterium]|jgi:hypothetical protein|nr:hypothetical protein [Acetobacteraceae bacterium]
MLNELDVLEARHIADLALDARKVRDRLLEKVREADLGEPKPIRGEHNPAANVELTDVLASEPEFVALNQAIARLPRDMREKIWLVMRVGFGDLGISDWDSAVNAASALTDDDLAVNLAGDPDLHDHLRKGLYALGAAVPPDNAG